MPRTLRFICILVLMTVAARGNADEADVIVYGGTAGGVIAAVAAAREGASVILLEPGKHLGGMVGGGLGWGDVNRPEIVGGYTREYFTRVGREYGKNDMVWHIEPHVAEKVFDDMIREAKVDVRLGQRLREKDALKLDVPRITEAITESGEKFRAKIWIDASYEGDLMASAGVEFHVGRESTKDYGERNAGIHGTKPSGIAGIAVDEDGPLPLVHTGAAGKQGDADEKVQCYNFRLCLTRRADNRVAIEKPANYNPRNYTMLARLLATMKNPTLASVLTISPLPNGKTDINNGGPLSTDLPNESWGYPNGTYAERENITARHRDYTLGLLWFLGNDMRVPESLRAETKEWGFAKDEFTDTANFPFQLYIREGRRMIGTYLMTEKDCRDENEKPDSIAMGSYMMDCHPVQRVLMPNNDFANEGYMGGNNRILPYEIPYRSLVPKREQCENLIVPVCMSASHVAWSSIRMEPQFMLMGHAAGVAAAMAARDHKAVQDVPTDALRSTLAKYGQLMRWKLPGWIDIKSLAGVVVDDDKAKFTGTWQATNVIGPLVGNCFRIAARGDEIRTARFTPELKAGSYEVRIFYAAASNRASNVKVTVHHAHRDEVLTIDERQPMPKDGRKLGRFDFSAGKDGYVEFTTENADGAVVVDAVQWLP
jgi:hypothetical protein